LSSPSASANFSGKTRARKSTAVDPKDKDAIRARRATANRTLTVLKAALNHAFNEGHVAHDDRWRKVKPFREVDAAIVRYLSEDECRRLVNACQGAFRNLVRAALLTGCRYGELTRMRAADFNGEAGTITVRESKAGKPRHVALTDEGQQLFASLSIGKAGRNLIFLRDDGAHWAASHQQRPLDAASTHARIEPAATFHILRHTYASALAMRGVPMGVIAAQLGHADTRMTEKHYAHLAPNYVAETVRAALPALGVAEKSNVAALRS
jgi:integrase